MASFATILEECLTDLHAEEAPAASGDDVTQMSEGINAQVSLD